MDRVNDMRICIIAEGSYPYVTGGVSSWIQMLMNDLPEHEFVIFTIGAEEKTRGIYKYKFPDNVKGITESFLDEFASTKSNWGKRYKISNEAKIAIKNLICGKYAEWDAIFAMVRGKSYDNVTNFLMSRNFLEIVQEASEEYYSQVSFTELYWTIKSMILPLFQIIKKDIPDADIYHSVSTGYAGIIGSLAKFLYDKPFILTEHGIYSREREEEIIKSDWLKGYFKEIWIEFFYSLSKKTYDSSDRVVSLYTRNMEIQKELGCDEGKITIIPNGVDFSKIATDKMNPPSDGFINIGALIRIVPIKDIKTMLHGFAIAKSEIKNLRLYLMGPFDEDEEYYMDCMQMVENMEIEDVIFTGMINPHDYMGKMDFLVLTSISEAQPFAILEGFAYKKPSVTTDVGSCRELIEGADDDFGIAGIVVPVMDYEKLGNAIIKLAKDPKLRAQFGENGFKRALALYSIDRFVNNYKKLYYEMR